MALFELKSNVRYLMLCISIGVHTALELKDEGRGCSSYQNVEVSIYSATSPPVFDGNMLVLKRLNIAIGTGMSSLLSPTF